MNGPERPVPLIGTNFGDCGVPPSDFDPKRCRSCASRSPLPEPSCSSERSMEQLHCALRRAVFLSRRVRSVRFGINRCSRRKRELSGQDDRFVRFDTAFYDREIAVLPLSRFDRAKIDRVVRFHHKNEWSVLTDLDRLCGNKPRIFDGVEDETNTDKL